MDFIADLPIFFWVFLVLAGIGGIYRLLVGQSTRRDMASAALLEQTDRWQESADIYRRLILDRMDFPDQAADAAAKLGALYRQHAVAANVGELDESMRVLADIDQSGGSDRQKAQMKQELRNKLVTILNALPPALEPPTAPTAKGKALNDTCTYCGETVSGRAWSFADYVDNEQLGVSGILGYVCPACGAVSHKDCQSGIVYKVWSGYEKSVCATCGQAVHEPTVVFPG